MYGYASSPIAFRELVIVPVGGRGKALMAFQQSDGSSPGEGDFGNVYSSPILIDVGGLEQLVAAARRRRRSASTRTTAICSGRFPSERTTRLLSRRRSGLRTTCCSFRRVRCGSKVIELQRNGLQTEATELWSSEPPAAPPRQRDARRRHRSILQRRKGQPGILSAVDVRTGKILWQERSIEKATFVWADGKLITLDQDGNLMIAHPSREGFTVSRAPRSSRISPGRRRPSLEPGCTSAIGEA